MKKIIRVILFGIVVFFPLVCTAAYVIHLEDGRSFTTSEYREEGDQIKFKRFGGVIGIPKDQVKEIEEVEDFPEEKAAAQKGVPDTAETAKQPEEKQEAAKNPSEEDVKAPSKPDETQPAAAPAKDKNIILKEFDSLKEKFRHVEIMSTDELYQFDKDLLALRNKILKAGLGGVYADKLVEILSMGSGAEEVLKKRGQ